MTHDEFRQHVRDIFRRSPLVPAVLDLTDGRRIIADMPEQLEIAPGAATLRRRTDNVVYRIDYDQIDQWSRSTNSRRERRPELLGVLQHRSAPPLAGAIPAVHHRTPRRNDTFDRSSRPAFSGRAVRRLSAAIRGPARALHLRPSRSGEYVRLGAGGLTHATRIVPRSVTSDVQRGAVSPFHCRDGERDSGRLKTPRGDSNGGRFGGVRRTGRDRSIVRRGVSGQVRVTGHSARRE